MFNFHNLFHKDFSLGKPERLVKPKAGPYDPRTDAQRTVNIYSDICAICGRIRKWEGTDVPGC